MHQCEFPEWPATQDRELVDAMGAVLAEFGGNCFLAPAAMEEGWARRLVAEPVLWEGDCHAIASTLDYFSASVVAAGATGEVWWGRRLDSSGVWLPAVWALNDGMLVDPTASCAQRYVGICLGAAAGILSGGDLERLRHEAAFSSMAGMPILLTARSEAFDEPIWATITGASEATINNIPFFAEDLSLRDVVRVEEQHGAWEIIEVLERRLPLRALVLFCEEAPLSLTSALTAAGIAYECDFGNAMTIAGDERRESELRDILVAHSDSIADYDIWQNPHR